MFSSRDNFRLDHTTVITGILLFSLFFTSGFFKGYRFSPTMAGGIGIAINITVSTSFTSVSSIASPRAGRICYGINIIMSQSRSFYFLDEVSALCTDCMSMARLNTRRLRFPFQNIQDITCFMLAWQDGELNRHCSGKVTNTC